MIAAMRGRWKYVALGVVLAPLIAIAFIVAVETAYGPLTP
jgi:hypothetical protein